ncbi:hypothetical protein NQ318_003721 [Aromia moschata]|uniref:DUF4817 domain-containing protein n=1 Tax=Aromia moschata TaxID=1265417 RepID=A0AAV8XG99_9CUCU|nr:hypothetical protein NQ318_003721 [Aromia moschata]
MHKTTILQMIGYGDRTRTQAGDVRLFQENYPELLPISQGIVSKIERQFRERGHVRQMPRHNLFTNSEMTDMEAIYPQQNFSERAAARSYADTYTNRRQPNRKLFSRLLSRLRETGSFRPSRHYGRPVVHNVQQEEEILNIFEGEPTINIRRMSANVRLSRSTTSRILHEQQLRPYHYYPLKTYYQVIF